MTSSEYKHKEDIITMTEVCDKFDTVLYDLLNLENTIRCFNRTWLTNDISLEDLGTITSFVNMLKTNFIKNTSSQLSYMQSGGGYYDNVRFN